MDDEQTKKDVQAALVKAMSPAARRAYKASPKALKCMSVYHLLNRQGHEFIVGDANFNKVTKPWEDQVIQRDQAQRRLEGIVKGCRTVKQLKLMMPEFQQYMPAEGNLSKNLPVVANVVSDLTRLGWPKGAKAQGDKA